MRLYFAFVIPALAPKVGPLGLVGVCDVDEIHIHIKKTSLMFQKYIWVNVDAKSIYF